MTFNIYLRKTSHILLPRSSNWTPQLKLHTVVIHIHLTSQLEDYGNLCLKVTFHFQIDPVKKKMKSYLSLTTVLNLPDYKGQLIFFIYYQVLLRMSLRHFLFLFIWLLVARWQSHVPRSHRATFSRKWHSLSVHQWRYIWNFLLSSI